MMPTPTAVELVVERDSDERAAWAQELAWIRRGVVAGLVDGRLEGDEPDPGCAR